MAKSEASSEWFAIACKCSAAPVAGELEAEEDDHVLKLSPMTSQATRARTPVNVRLNRREADPATKIRKSPSSS